MLKILVTGGAGNVGGALARKLVENKNYFVVIADNLSTVLRKNYLQIKTTIGILFIAM